MLQELKITDKENNLIFDSAYIARVDCDEEKFDDDEYEKGEDTVRMISKARFSVGILLLHHYRKDLPHLSYLYSLVIVLY